MNGIRRLRIANQLRLRLALVVLALVAVACTDQGETPESPTSTPEPSVEGLGQSQIMDLVWEALAPNTSSGDRANWEVAVAQQVLGRQVAEQFEGEPAPGCWKGPTPEENGEVIAVNMYWYVRMQPRPATAVPQQGTVSPTAPPIIPEPFLRDAYFLLDPIDGRVIARKLLCVIY